MERDSIPVAQMDANTKPVTGSRWNRNRIEVHGRSDRNYIHQVSPLLMKSYAEIGAFPHEYHIWDSPCATHYHQFSSAYMLRVLYSTSGTGTGTDDRMNALNSVESSLARLGVSAMEFDTKGTYLASVTRSRCLTVHKFESLYSQSNESDQGKDEKKQLRHFSLSNPNDYVISAVCWNPSDQDEIAYTSMRSGELTIFDIEYNQTVQVLSKRHPVYQGLSDVAFFDDGNRVLASDTSGAITMWDRRVSFLPQRVLTTKKNIGLTSIQLLGDQCVYGASKSGFIYIWDLRRLRGGRSSAASQSDKEIHSSPLTSVNLESMLNEIRPLKEQANIQLTEIQSININPSRPYQLGFHLADGWSGVLDMHNFQVSHIHCPPPPPFLEQWKDHNVAVSLPRKPSWLPEHSIYVAPSSSSNGLHLLDFYPHPSSPCHVYYDESRSPREGVKRKKNAYVPLSKPVTACATHPLNGTIVAGTMNASVLLVSQKHLCKKGDGDDDDPGTAKHNIEE